MPKSSMAIRTPRSVSARRARTGSSAPALIMVLSVISSWSRSGGRPVCGQQPATSSHQSPGACTCRTARLTLTNGAGPAVGRPALGLPARLGEHPAAEPDDQPGLLGQPDEAAGAQHPQLGVPPADQRLHPEQRAVAQRGQRLVVQEELAPVQGGGHRRRQGVPGQLGALRAGSNSAHRAPPAALAQCRVLSAARINSPGVVPATGPLDDADAGRDAQLVPVGQGRLADRRQRRLGAP